MSRNLEVIRAVVRLVATGNSDLFISYPLMFLDSILELFLLVMQGIVTQLPPVIPDVLRIVKITLR